MNFRDDASAMPEGAGPDHSDHAMRLDGAELLVATGPDAGTAQAADVAQGITYRRSLRASRTRRRAAALRRRRALRSRGTLLATSCGLLLASAGAIAAPGGSLDATPSRETIAAVQEALGMEPDGVLGDRTRRAVRRFQRRHGLDPDGLLGPRTLAAMGVSVDVVAGSRMRVRRRANVRAAAASTAPSVAPSEAALLARIARCESGGNPRAISSGGHYRGKYQFSYPTWRSVGGTGDPARASEQEQDRRAAMLLRRDGTRPWPNCA